MSASKYQQIKQHILDKVESGQWPENHPVPSENQLALSFSVSRMTARRALHELSEQGVLIRTQGAATVVASLTSQSSLLEIRNIADEIRARHHHYHAKVLALNTLKTDDALASQLQVEVNSDIAYSCICHYENQVAVQLEQRYVNLRLAKDYLQQDYTLITPHEYLCNTAPLTEAKHQIEAILPDELMQWSLSIEANQPCLHMHRHTWSKDGVVSYALLTYPGNRYSLGGRLTFPPNNKEKTL
ncbi:histidine utilization repressor [Neptunicella sp. SCSIO 80796]|uniref:histidine utilization repressor n=1 Tax=Neptunicella plasticusilytica TaxID=3117012 RepID=UPI003A4D2AC2